jgi:2,3-dihydroxybiphenyl 1,2-dioxygenase
MAVERLGYIGIEAPDPVEWATFFADVVGLMPADRSANGDIGFRLDDHAQRFLVKKGAADDVAFVGWEVKDSVALANMRARLEAEGVSVSIGDEELAADRGVESIFFFDDPNDIRTEIYWGPNIAEQPFHAPLNPEGFVTGDCGLGHVVFGVKDWRETFDFYTGPMGLRLSDNIKAEPVPGIDVQVTFLHANPRHHSYAFVVPPVPFPKKLQHFMIEAREMSAVGRAFDRFRDSDVPIAMTLGHHPNDQAFSFYGKAPNGIEIEFGWGALRIESDDEWQPRTYSQLSDWGHRPPAA